MAKTDLKTRETEEEKSLKYLSFVHVAIVQAMVLLCNLYERAKEKAGPLKPTVQSVEGTVKGAAAPLCERFRDVPFSFLRFIDRKVDNMLTEADRHVPVLVKSVSCRAYTMSQKAPETARSIVGEVKRSGVVATASGVARELCARYEPVAKETYARYEPVAERYAVAAWWSLNRLPMFPQVAQIALPTAAYWAEKYNQVVNGAAARGYEAARYLPLVPTERIAKVLGEGGAEEPATNGTASAAEAH